MDGLHSKQMLTEDKGPFPKGGRENTIAMW
jgi:hypothetical protein